MKGFRSLNKMNQKKKRILNLSKMKKTNQNYEKNYKRMKQNKDKYNNVKCEALELLTQHVKVKMLEGPAVGLIYKYYYEKVELVPSATPSTEPPATHVSPANSSIEPPAAPPTQSAPKNAEMEISDLMSD